MGETTIIPAAAIAKLRELRRSPTCQHTPLAALILDVGAAHDTLHDDVLGGDMGQRERRAAIEAVGAELIAVGLFALEVACKASQPTVVAGITAWEPLEGRGRRLDALDFYA